MKMFHGLALFVVALVTTVIAPPQAKAILTLTLQNGSTTVSISDACAAGCTGGTDLNGLANVVTFIGTVGDWLVNVSTTLSNNNTNPLLDLNSIDSYLTASGGSSPLTIEASQNGYTNGLTAVTTHVGGTISPGSGGSATYTAFGGNSDTLFDYSNQLGPVLGPFTTPSFSGDGTGGTLSVNPYSLTLRAVLDYTTAGFHTTSADFAINGVPEPTSVSLMIGLVLVAAGALRRKMRQA
jgi:hypothetical protein